MNKKPALIGFAIIAVVGVLFLAKANSDVVSNTQSEISHLTSEQKKLTVYKSPTCGCCGQYVAYLKGIGFEVDVVDDDVAMSQVKQDYGIPNELQSCHTTLAGNYVIEGHIPFEGVNKLLTEQPDIEGIILPGMPSATPGMPGAKTEEWNIRQLNSDDSISTFMVI